MAEPQSDPSQSPPDVELSGAELPNTAPPRATTRQPGALPLWLSALIILLCLAGGIWFTLWYFRTPPSRQIIGDAVPLTDNPRQPRPDRRPARAQQPPQPARRSAADVRQLPDRNGAKRWMVRSGWARMFVTQPPTGPLVFNFSYAAATIISDQAQRNLWLMFYRVRADASTAAYLKLTPEQQTSLSAISTQLTMAVSFADHQHITEAWNRRQNASPSEQAGADEVLIQVLRQVSDNSAAASRKELAARLEQIRAIFTPDQIKAFATMGNPG